MNEKLRDYFEEQEKLQRKKYENERDELLIQLGLVEEERIYSSDSYNPDLPHIDMTWDRKVGAYYYNKPISVTDEEFARIKNYNQLSSEAKPKVVYNGVDGSAEKTLTSINSVMFVVCIIAACVLFYLAWGMDSGGEMMFVASISFLIVSAIVWLLVRVIINMSNNLHNINAKLK